MRSSEPTGPGAPAGSAEPAKLAGDAALCAVVAARLAAERTLGAFGLALAVATLLVAAVEPLRSFGAIALPAAVVLAVGERYLLLRIDLDARLFAWLAHRPDVASALAAMDDALVGLHLLPAAKAGRPLPSRVAGARRLLRRHAAIVVAQAVVAMAVAISAVVTVAPR